MAEEKNYEYYESSHTGDQIENSIWCVRRYIENKTSFNKNTNYLGNMETKVTNLEAKVGADNISGTLIDRITALENKVGSSSGTYVPLSQGYIDLAGIDNTQSIRVKIDGLISGPFSIEVNEGYLIKAIQECASRTPSVNDVKIAEAAEQTSYTGGTDGKYYAVIFSKTDSNANISPTENIIKNFTGTLVSLISADSSIEDRVTVLEDIIDPANYTFDGNGAIPQRFLTIEETIDKDDDTNPGLKQRISALEETDKFQIEACTINGRTYDPSLPNFSEEDSLEKRRQSYLNGYSKVIAYNHVANEPPGEDQKWYYKDEEGNYQEITLENSNYYSYQAIPFYKPALQYTGGSAEHNSTSTPADFYEINTVIDDDGNISNTYYSITIKKAGLYQISGSVYMDSRSSDGRYCKAYILYKDNNLENDFVKSPHLIETEEYKWTFEGDIPQIEEILYKKDGDKYISRGKPYARELVFGSADIKGIGTIAIPPKIVYLNENSELFLAVKGRADYNAEAPVGQKYSNANIIYPGSPSTYLSILKISK